MPSRLSGRSFSTQWLGPASDKTPHKVHKNMFTRFMISKPFREAPVNIFGTILIPSGLSGRPSSRGPGSEEFEPPRAAKRLVQGTNFDVKFEGLSDGSFY